ncbi:MAG: transcription termination/antitermination protein NusG [Phycisphaerae bacterium]
MSNPGSIKGWDTWQATLRAEPRAAIPDDLPGRWWVAHTRPRNEKALALDLRARGILHYLPLCVRSTRARASGRLSRSIVPVFPGYVFFNGNDAQRQSALTTNRIANTLAVVNQLQLVGELRQIQHVLSAQTDFDWQPRIEIGQWARVIAGPLYGIEGVVCKRMSRMRLALNVRMLSQSVVVEVARDMLEKIDAPSYAS